MTKSILAIIPARAGSKGLKNKNILPLDDKPLISYTINASLKSEFITDIVLSSDGDEILNIAKTYNIKTIKRPKTLALDNSPSEELIIHALEILKKQYDYIILLQPTSPLRSEEDIDEAFKHLFSSNANCLISVKNYDSKILKTFMYNEKKFLEGISNNSYPFMRRQDLPKVYMPNGAIYIIETGEFKKKQTLFTDKTIPFIMSEEKSKDIDTKKDLLECEDYLKTLFK